MYPYQAKNANPCYDSSPTFAERPAAAFPVGYPFTYNHNAFDADFDSLAYTWASPLDEGNWPSPSVTFETGYSINSQLPGPSIDSNNSVPYINPKTGEISFESYTSGQFTTTIKVASYRCGTIIAETFRDMAVSLVVPTALDPLNVTPPFQDANGVNTLFVDTVYAGQQVTIPIASEYFGSNVNGEGLIFTDASSPQFNSDYTTTTSGCLLPPCAALSPAPTTQTGSVDISLATITWQTNCNHINKIDGNSCNNGNTYTFVVKTRLNQCPIPQVNISTIRIVVLPLPPVNTPNIQLIEFDANGNTHIVVGALTDTLNVAIGYNLFMSSNGLNYQLADSLAIFTDTTITLPSIWNLTGMTFFYLQAINNACVRNKVSATSNVYITQLTSIKPIQPKINVRKNGSEYIIEAPSICKKTNIILSDLTGKKIILKNNEFEISSFKLDVANISNGTYLLFMSCEGYNYKPVKLIVAN